MQENPDSKCETPPYQDGVCIIHGVERGDCYMVFSMLIVCLIFLRLRRLKIKIDFRF